MYAEVRAQPIAASRSFKSAGSWAHARPFRRRDVDALQETWLIYYGDVRVGAIAMRSGNPADTDPWGWSCGFYPGSHPRECTSGTAATFDQARADFEAAWRVFLSNRTEADFDEYRKHCAWTAWKYAMWDSGCKLQIMSSSLFLCISRSSFPASICKISDGPLDILRPRG